MTSKGKGKGRGRSKNTEKVKNEYDKIDTSKYTRVPIYYWRDIPEGIDLYFYIKHKKDEYQRGPMHPGGILYEKTEKHLAHGSKLLFYITPRGKAQEDGANYPLEKMCEIYVLDGSFLIDISEDLKPKISKIELNITNMADRLDKLCQITNNIREYLGADHKRRLAAVSEGGL